MKESILKIDKVKQYYDKIWSETLRANATDDQLLEGFHYGFFEKGIKSISEAIENMNNYVDRLIDFKENKSLNILDVGCGVGSTSIYLAQKYPQSNFFGVSIGQNEINFAKKLSQDKNLKNISFIQGDFSNTNYPDNSFDVVFALESMSYADDKEIFIKEMNRILKPSGKLVIIDGFIKKIPEDCIMKKILNAQYGARGSPELISLDILFKHLKNSGFIEVTMNNISKNIKKHFVYIFFNSIPGILPILFLGKIKPKKETQQQKYRYESMLIFFDCFFDITKIVSFNSITAKKSF